MHQRPPFAAFRALTKEAKESGPQRIHAKMAFGVAVKYLIRLRLESFSSKLNLYLNGLASMMSSYQ